MDVIVVGAGPVGMTIAALLDTAGVRVEVVERSSEPVRQSRGSTMHPRTLEVLTVLETGDGCRLSDVLVELGKPVTGTHYATLPDLLDYQDLDTPFPFVLLLAQWRTEQALAELLRAREVPVHYGAEVTEVVQSDDEVRVLAGGTWHSARYVVGADGAHSAVRKAAGIAFPGTTPNAVGFVGDVRLAHPPEHSLHLWDQERGSVSVIPLTDTATRVFGMRADDVGLTAAQARRRQAEPLTFAELADSVTGISGRDFGLRDASWLSRSSNSARHATTYRAGRVFLTGDAGHVHLPAGGQGFNVGIQDATNLAWKLAAEVAGRAPGLLITGEAAYDAERRPVAERLVADTQAQDALMHTFSPAGAALRSLFGSFIAQGGEVAQQLAGAVSGLAVAYPHPDGAHALVGTRAPDLPLTKGSVLRALRPDRFLLLDLTADASLAKFGSPQVEVRTAALHDGPRRAAWDSVRAALIRPDGYVAYAASSPAGLADAVAAWLEPASQPDAVRGK
ncbi:FAD-dependent monooxygenase [Amycolatopsis jiangsuensis]|uniref:2-polyprenyl-6-methoxyphenol hydroxylase-like FAD-dependent oxidoreductase n=1 Tax=Amycolatopsis jiangsuensis TaxID=1181879 RepID=A0A840J3Y2_9PSEU|nr:FAD-dependent monooxygenase [Amycolatopsis jiangsuensis]MBB4688573.1 2-polyprenyl-6-methoxyphenol hydroxylase-like FAD-dependent oxidoreductase [Amycolatopsis jiangsuensis]